MRIQWTLTWTLFKREKFNYGGRFCTLLGVSAPWFDEEKLKLGGHLSPVYLLFRSKRLCIPAVRLTWRSVSRLVEAQLAPWWLSNQCGSEGNRSEVFKWYSVCPGKLRRWIKIDILSWISSLIFSWNSQPLTHHCNNHLIKLLFYLVSAPTMKNRYFIFILIVVPSQIKSKHFYFLYFSCFRL